MTSGRVAVLLVTIPLVVGMLSVRISDAQQPLPRGAASSFPVPSPLASPGEDGIGCDTPPPTPVPAPPVPAPPLPSLDPVATGAPALPTGPTPTPAPTPGPASAPTPSPGPTPVRVQGIDVSHWNGFVRWQRVAKAGVRFAFVKATQGRRITDARYARNVGRAREHGIAVGSYHFFDYRQRGAPQADHFVDVMSEHSALDELLPPVVDVECFELFGPADQAYVRRQLRAFVDRVRERTGRTVMVYTGRWAWRETTGDSDGFGDLPLWIACWTCSTQPLVPPGWQDWAVWQTGSAAVRGVGRVGTDVLAGSLSDR